MHLAGGAPQESHHMLGSVHLLVCGARPSPDVQALWRFQHKHVVAVEVGGRSLDLQKRTEREQKLFYELPLGGVAGQKWATDLHSARSSRRALSDVEEAGAGRLRMSAFGRGASEVDDHGFATEHAHQVRRLLPLSDSHLVTR